MISGGATLASLSVKDMESVFEAAERYNLDFDDAYQYAVSEKYGLTLVSFDSDFDRTAIGRKTAAEILRERSS